MNDSLNPGETVSAENRTTVMNGEDVLDLQLSPLSKSTAAEEIDECNEHLSVNDQPVAHQVGEVSIAAIDTLLSFALRLKTNDYNFVTGVKLHFGILDSEIVLIYQPLYMHRPPSGLSEPTYDLTGGHYYKYDPSSEAFSQITSTVADTLTASYRSEIKIKHRTDTTFTEYIPNVDTDSVIFPFQTIYALLKDNDAETLYIYNSIRKEDAGTSYRIKHCLLLAAESLNANSFTGKFANRSHLCPPSCNSVQYAIKLS